MKQQILDLIGNSPKEPGFKSRMRLHQGWWRACVLGEEQGPHPVRKDERICNTIENGQVSGSNFLSDNIRTAVRLTIEERALEGAGIVEAERLYNNLLSSQPLCFNFFGELKMDKALADNVLSIFYPDITAVKEVVFEYAPPEKYTNDNSAFDVAFEVERGNQTGMIGLECKYTDTFSKTRYDKPIYRTIFEQSEIFLDNYEAFVSSRYNQLFRNQLIAEAMQQRGKYDFVWTGLFCHHDDKSGVETGRKFQTMLGGGSKFQIITYRNFIEAVQNLKLGWDIREVFFLLWARYCSTQLSDKFF